MFQQSIIIITQVIIQTSLITILHKRHQEILCTGMHIHCIWIHNHITRVTILIDAVIINKDNARKMLRYIKHGICTAKLWYNSIHLLWAIAISAKCPASQTPIINLVSIYETRYLLIVPRKLHKNKHKHLVLHDFLGIAFKYQMLCLFRMTIWIVFTYSCIDTTTPLYSVSQTR